MQEELKKKFDAYIIAVIMGFGKVNQEVIDKIWEFVNENFEPLQANRVQPEVSLQGEPTVCEKLLKEHGNITFSNRYNFTNMPDATSDDLICCVMNKHARILLKATTIEELLRKLLSKHSEPKTN